MGGVRLIVVEDCPRQQSSGTLPLYATATPAERAQAWEDWCNLLRPHVVIPMHFGTFPALTGTPAKLREEIADAGVEVHALKPGETWG